MAHQGTRVFAQIKLEYLLKRVDYTKTSVRGTRHQNDALNNNWDRVSVS